MERAPGGIPLRIDREGRGSGVPSAATFSEIVSPYLAIPRGCEAENFASASSRIEFINCGRHGGATNYRVSGGFAGLGNLVCAKPG
jgi:hypothetical protein